jgi:hypothetical protein
MGNFSSTDEFPGHLCNNPPSGGCGGTYAVCLEQNTPSMWRIRNGSGGTLANAQQTLQSYFNPSFSTNPTAGAGTTTFMARITDANTGKYHFVVLCSGAGTTGLNATAAAVNISSNTPILRGSDTVAGGGGIAGFGTASLVISPVQIVSWQLQPATTIPVAGTNAFGVTAPLTADPKEYVLTRGYVDALTSAPYAPDPNTLEVVSEYAVDLKFAFTVDSSNPAIINPPGAFPVGANPLLPLLLDTAVNATWAPDVSTVIPYIPPTGPHRIRSVRVRVGIRTAAPDRSSNFDGTQVYVSPVPNTGQPYMYRYFVPGAANGLQWARVRTGVTEAALPNQSRLYW